MQNLIMGVRRFREVYTSPACANLDRHSNYRTMVSNPSIMQV